MKLAMFDWNGTLLDDVKIAYEGVCRIFRHFNLKPPSLEEYRNEITADIVSFYYERGIPRDVDLKAMTAIYKTAIEENWQYTELVRYAVPLIHHCKNKNMKTALITMESSEAIQKRLQQFKLSDAFDEVHPRTVDKARVIKFLLATHGIKDPKEAFYIGDIVADIEAAKDAGVVAIAMAHDGAYNSKRRLKAAQPDLVVETLWEAILWLSKDDPAIDVRTPGGSL